MSTMASFKDRLDHYTLVQEWLKYCFIWLLNSSEIRQSHITVSLWKSITSMKRFSNGDCVLNCYKGLDSVVHRSVGMGCLYLLYARN